MTDEKYADDLAKAKATLEERGIAVPESDTDEHRNQLLDELGQRSWEWKYESGGRGFVVKTRKSWYPSTFYTNPGEEGETLVDALILVLADAIKFDDTKAGQRVGAQFYAPW